MINWHRLCAEAVSSVWLRSLSGVWLFRYGNWRWGKTTAPHLQLLELKLTECLFFYQFSLTRCILLFFSSVVGGARWGRARWGRKPVSKPRMGRGCRRRRLALCISSCDSCERTTPWLDGFMGCCAQKPIKAQLCGHVSSGVIVRQRGRVEQLEAPKWFKYCWCGFDTKTKSFLHMSIYFFYNTAMLLILRHTTPLFAPFFIVKSLRIDRIMWKHCL